jgi:GNAT superfamily N-acetyltransferase
MSGEVMKKVIAPKGYYFRVVKPYVHGGFSIRLFKKNNSGEIGHVNLQRKDNGDYGTHSYLFPQYRNQGLGALMYAKAIQWGREHGLRVRSSGGSSDDAQRVWRGSSLQRWFDVKVKSGYERRQDTFYPRLKKEDRCPVSSKKRPAKKRR